jgi:hypothetical protein
MGAWGRRGSFLPNARSPTRVVRMFKRTYDVAGKLLPNLQSEKSVHPFIGNVAMTLMFGKKLFN